jgi:hypothetical protein
LTTVFNGATLADICRCTSRDSRLLERPAAILTETQRRTAASRKSHRKRTIRRLHQRNITLQGMNKRLCDDGYLRCSVSTRYGLYLLTSAQFLCFLMFNFQPRLGKSGLSTRPAQTVHMSSNAKNSVQEAAE